MVVKPGLHRGVCGLSRSVSFRYGPMRRAIQGRFKPCSTPRAMRAVCFPTGSYMDQRIFALDEEDGVRAAYRAYGAELFGFACRSLGDHGLAEEAVQETFLRAWRA